MKRGQERKKVGKGTRELTYKPRPLLEDDLSDKPCTNNWVMCVYLGWRPAGCRGHHLHTHRLRNSGK